MRLNPTHTRNHTHATLLTPILGQGHDRTNYSTYCSADALEQYVSHNLIIIMIVIKHNSTNDKHNNNDNNDNNTNVILIRESSLPCVRTAFLSLLLS